MPTIVADIRKPCWKTDKNLSSAKIFFCFLRKLNLVQLEKVCHSVYIHINKGSE